MISFFQRSTKIQNLSIYYANFKGGNISFSFFCYIIFVFSFLFCLIFLFPKELLLLGFVLFWKRYFLFLDFVFLKKFLFRKSFFVEEISILKRKMGLGEWKKQKVVFFLALWNFKKRGFFFLQKKRKYRNGASKRFHIFCVKMKIFLFLNYKEIKK